MQSKISSPFKIEAKNWLDKKHENQVPYNIINLCSSESSRCFNRSTK